ncbi:MAG: hypothetical protein RL701_6775 [Pseudomonadota bacterium]
MLASTTHALHSTPHPLGALVADVARSRHDPGSGHDIRVGCKRRGPQLRARCCQFALIALCATNTARAQNSEDMLPLTDDPTDPIGIDREPVAPATAADSGARSTPRPRQRVGNSNRFGPDPPPLAVQSGDVITGPASVHESSHNVQLELSEGLVRVREELTFDNAGDRPAELAYRLAIPADAALFGLEVCNAHGCRRGVPDPSRGRLNAYDDAVQARGPTRSTGLPAGDARSVRDARGPALRLRAAPVAPRESLHVHVDYLTLATAHAGVVRLTLPARGMDARTVPLKVRVQATNHADLRVNGVVAATADALTIDSWSPIEISARSQLTGSHALLWQTPCGKTHCLHAFASSSQVATTPTEIFLAIDASPSTEGAARSRLLVTIAALLSQAPAGSYVRALRFAGRAAPLIAERRPAADLALDRFAPIAFEAELGSATRFEAAWQLIEQWGLTKSPGVARKLVIIVGDGGVTTGPARPFEAAHQKHVEVAVLNVGDRPTHTALARGAQLTGGAVVELGSEAALALTGGSERLEERVAAVFQPSRGSLRIVGSQAAVTALRAGDSFSWQGVSTGAAALRWGDKTSSVSAAPSALAPALSAFVTQPKQAEQRARWVAVDRADLERKLERPPGQDDTKADPDCDRRGPASSVSGLSSDATPVNLAEERALCVASPALTRKPGHGNHGARDDSENLAVGAGMPSSPLLSMLRLRILPAARGCFRRDRAGRADYQVRATFEFELAEREVVSARVSGKIAEPLRLCLLAAVDSLAIPPFSGRVVVRYPLVTEREPLPSQVELTTGTAAQVDALTR